MGLGRQETDPHGLQVSLNCLAIDCSGITAPGGQNADGGAFFQDCITCQRARHGLSDKISSAQLQASSTATDFFLPQPFAPFLAGQLSQGLLSSYVQSPLRISTQNRMQLNLETEIQILSISLTKYLGRWREAGIITSNTNTCSNSARQYNTSFQVSLLNLAANDTQTIAFGNAQPSNP